MEYGTKLAAYRLEKELTLRKVSLASEVDVAYLSRIERGTIPPPQKEEILDGINEALDLTRDESRRMKDLAAADNKKYPSDIAESLAAVKGVPLLLRTVATKKPTESEIKEIIRIINERY